MFTRVMSYELSLNDERGDIPQSFRGRAHHDASLRSGSAPSKSRRERLLDRLVSTLGEIGLVLTELWKLQQLAVVHVAGKPEFIHPLSSSRELPAGKPEFIHPRSSSRELVASQSRVLKRQCCSLITRVLRVVAKRGL